MSGGDPARPVADWARAGHTVAVGDDGSHEPAERRVEVDGLRINVRERGEGAPLCLINGLGANVRMLAAFQDGLTGHHTIAFDAPGAGHSDTPTVPLSFGGVARVIAELLRKLGCARVDVIGYSFGGGIAQQLAHDYPDIVRRLVLAATSCGLCGVPGHPIALGAVLTPLRYYSPRFSALAAPLMGEGRAGRDPAVTKAQAEARLSSPPSPIGYVWQLLAGASWSSWGWLPSIRQPALVVTGDRDRLVPAVNGTLLAARLPSARLMVVRGEDHHLLADSGGRVADAIREYLGSETVERSRTWARAVEVPQGDAELLAFQGMWPSFAANAIWRSGAR